MLIKLSIKRLIAYWLDFVILAIILVGSQWLLSKTISGFPYETLTEGYEIELWVLLTVSLPVWLYFICSEYFVQKTIGKRLLKLTVVSESGVKISLSQAFKRTFIRLLPWELAHIIVLIPEPWFSVEHPDNFYLIYIPNFIIIFYTIILLVNRGNKGLHDFVAKTKVHEN